jgi:Na+/H+ antiporter 1
MPFRRSARQVRRVLDPMVEFLRIEAVGGAVLLAATITALVLANSPLADGYRRLWQHQLTVGGLTWDLRHWVNDALMTVFFLVIGLEVKRELTIGRLRDPRRATLPIVAALAGAAVPALVFLAFNWCRPIWWYRCSPWRMPAWCWMRRGCRRPGGAGWPGGWRSGWWSASWPGWSGRAWPPSSWGGGRCPRT